MHHISVNLAFGRRDIYLRLQKARGGGKKVIVRRRQKSVDLKKNFKHQSFCGGTPHKSAGAPNGNVAPLIWCFTVLRRRKLVIYCFREEGDDSVPSLLVNSDERWQLVLLKFGHVQEDMRRNSHSKLGLKQTKLFFLFIS